MGWRGTIRYSVTVMRISTVTGGKAGYHIRRYPYFVWLRALCTVQVRSWTFSSALGLFVLTNCYKTYHGGTFFSWRKRPMQLGVHNVGVWRKGLSLSARRRYIYPVCEVSVTFVTQLSEPPIPGLSLPPASQWTFVCPPVSLPQGSSPLPFDCPQA